MDQLKILMEHRFWVLSALAVLLPPIGWWVSTGDMATQTETQTKKINGEIKKIDDRTSKASTYANQEWIDGAKKVNARLATFIGESQKTLYKHQQPSMVFWPTIRKPLEESKVKYRGETAPNPQVFLDARRLFISRYTDMWMDEVLKVIEPFDLVTGDGKVWCLNDNGGIPIMKAPVASWQQRQMIGADEMWAAQEDLWMLHALMKAVARVNEGSSNIDNARIKRLISAKLRGGSLLDLNDRRTKKKGNAAPGGAPGGASGGAPSGGFGGMGGMMGMGRLEADQGPKAQPLIDPDDIFGSGEDAGAAAAQATTKKRGIGDLEGETRPYVETDPSNRWRTRGFILDVVMDHQEIPKLLTVLTESPFPVQIFQVEHLPFDSSKTHVKSALTLGPENAEQQKIVKNNEERVAMAMNQSNLAEVLVAGTFLLYNEPASMAEPAPAATGAGAAPPATKTPPGGTAAAKGAPVGSPAPSSGAKPASPTAPAPKSSPSSNTATPSKGAPAAGGSTTAPTSPKPGAATPAASGSTAPKSAQPAKS
jgi:hypothetical protein